MTPSPTPTQGPSHKPKAASRTALGVGVGVGVVVAVVGAAGVVLWYRRRGMHSGQGSGKTQPRADVYAKVEDARPAVDSKPQGSYGSTYPNAFA